MDIRGREARMTVIAMTREIGSGGTEVAAGVAAALGLKIVNSEIVVSTAAGSLGMTPSTVQRYLDGTASLFERWQIDKRKLSRFTSEQIFALAQEGNVLIRGWGAGALFRDIPHVISVRVCAPLALRERAMMGRLEMNDVDDVRDEIARFDAAHDSAMRASFDIDRADALLYHLVLNAGRVPVDACVKMICQLASDPRFQDDAVTHAAIADKLLESKARAFLTERVGVEMASITVAASNAKLIFSGVTSTGNLPARLEKLAREVEGVAAIEDRIQSVPPVSVRFGRDV
jgi:cytidylate kinase